MNPLFCCQASAAYRRGLVFLSRKEFFYALFFSHLLTLLHGH